MSPKEIDFSQGFNAFVETPQGSNVKYKLDKDSGSIIVDHIVYEAMVYPFNYGFIPDTKTEDGEALDVLVLSSWSVYPGIIIPARAIGMLEMEDERGIDNKILAVPQRKTDPFFAEVNDVEDLDPATREKIRHFFEHYKELEPQKWAKIKNFHGKDMALEIIKKSAK